MTSLEDRATAALGRMLLQIQTSNTLDPLFFFFKGDETIELPMPPETRDIMNSGPAKDKIFRFCRELVAAQGVDACVFGSDTWGYYQTESAQKAHTAEQLFEMCKRYPLQVLVDLALLERRETLLVVAQSASEVLLLHQHYRRAPFRTCGAPDLQRFEQQTFAGRMKMFGDLRPENLCEHGTSAEQMEKDFAG